MSRPERPGKRLTEEAEIDYADYLRASRETSCYCHLCPPCNLCLHPGNPLNLENSDCAWEADHSEGKAAS